MRTINHNTRLYHRYYHGHNGRDNVRGDHIVVHLLHEQDKYDVSRNISYLSATECIIMSASIIQIMMNIF